MSHSETTVVHVVRHGEVFNPDKILYGRLDGYRLSDLGRDMAGVVADYFADHDVTTVTASSLQRAQETTAPIAAAHGVTVRTDDRVIEAANYFEGRPVAMATFLHPRSLLQMYNVARPSWGEPYAEILDRMTQALVAARDLSRGHEAVIVSHQLPIWTLRSHLEGRRLWHYPSQRECSLASVTSVTYSGDEVTSVSYAEPAHHLLARSSKGVGA